MNLPETTILASRASGRMRVLRLVVIAVASACLMRGVGFGAQEDTDTPTLTPRQIYNEGTQKLRTGKFRDAESSLQNAVGSQDERVQSVSLYNLGHARYQEGAEQLKKQSGDNSTARAASDHAVVGGESAFHGAEAALEGDDLTEIVAAYYRGRGARKELKAAREAVKHAVEQYGAILTKWRRARGDFASAHELRQSDADAQANAQMMDESIARLVDLQQMMMQSMAGMNQQRSELRTKMQALKKRMPQGMQGDMKGHEGDDDDEDEGKNGKQKQEPKPGEREPESRDGSPRVLTQEEAMRLLGMFKLDSEHKLPIGMGDTAEPPKDRKVRDW